MLAVPSAASAEKLFSGGTLNPKLFSNPEALSQSCKTSLDDQKGHPDSEEWWNIDTKAPLDTGAAALKVGDIFSCIQNDNDKKTAHANLVQQLVSWPLDESGYFSASILASELDFVPSEIQHKLQTAEEYSGVTIKPREKIGRSIDISELSFSLARSTFLSNESFKYNGNCVSQESSVSFPIKQEYIPHISEIKIDGSIIYLKAREQICRKNKPYLTLYINFPIKKESENSSPEETVFRVDLKKLEELWKMVQKKGESWEEDIEEILADEQTTQEDLFIVRSENNVPITEIEDLHLSPESAKIFRALSTERQNALINGARNYGRFFQQNQKHLLFLLEEKNPSAGFINDNKRAHFPMFLFEEIYDEYSPKDLVSTINHELFHKADLVVGIRENPSLEALFEKLKTSKTGILALQMLSEKNFLDDGYGGHAEDSVLEVTASFFNDLAHGFMERINILLSKVESDKLEVKKGITVADREEYTAVTKKDFVEILKHYKDLVEVYISFFEKYSEFPTRFLMDELNKTRDELEVLIASRKN